MKATLVFDIPEEQEEFNLAVKAGNLSLTLWDVRQEVFRPARKHGYSDPELAALISKHPEAAEIVGKLEDLFNAILSRNGLDDV